MCKCVCAYWHVHVCVGLAIHTYAGRQVSRSMGLWGGYMLLFGCLSFCLSVVLESLNLGDAGDLEVEILKLCFTLESPGKF